MVLKRQRYYQNESELKQAITECWEKMAERNPEYIQIMVDGYKRRLRGVISNNGYNTRY